MQRMWATLLIRLHHSGTKQCRHSYTSIRTADFTAELVCVGTGSAHVSAQVTWTGVSPGALAARGSSRFNRRALCWDSSVTSIALLARRLASYTLQQIRFNTG